MSKKAIAIYLRVSTTGQDLASQEPDLKAWLRGNRKGRRVTWYRDTFTGVTMKRPGMQDLERDIRAGKIGTVVVWRLDRLGRTVLELLTWLDALEVAGVEFVSVRDAVDTTTAAGRLFRTILAGFAEYERELIGERVRAGQAKARARGKRWGGRKPGTKPKLKDDVVDTIKTLVQEAERNGKRVNKAAIARQLGIDRKSVYNALEL